MKCHLTSSCRLYQPQKMNECHISPYSMKQSAQNEDCLFLEGLVSLDVIRSRLRGCFCGLEVWVSAHQFASAWVISVLLSALSSWIGFGGWFFFKAIVHCACMEESLAQSWLHYSFTDSKPALHLLCPLLHSYRYCSIGVSLVQSCQTVFRSDFLREHFTFLGCFYISLISI